MDPQLVESILAGLLTAAGFSVGLGLGLGIAALMALLRTLSGRP